MTKNFTEKTELEKRLEAEAAAEAAVLKDEGNQTASASEPGSTLAQEVEALKAERDEFRDQFLRSRAEFDNYRKRKLREEEQFRKTAARAIVLDLLPVLDNLERALQHADSNSMSLAEGVAMVAKQFRETLERHGVTAIAAKGLPFDPSVHEAVMEQEQPDVPLHTVLEEVQCGYMLGNQLLRAAKVIVSTGGPVREAENVQFANNEREEPEDSVETEDATGVESSSELETA